MKDKLFRTKDPPVLGVVVVVPGLNNKPAVMDSLVRRLNKSGFHCLRVSLYESRSSDHLSSEAIAERWIQEVEMAHSRLTKSYKRLPLFNLSYSLGALVTIRFLQMKKSALFRRMVLLAPALVLAKRASLIHFVTPLSAFGLALPSLAPDAVRARSATPLREYAAMLRMVSEVESLAGAEKIGRIRTQLFLNPKDELVSYQGVRDWVQRNTSEAWTLDSIRVGSKGAYQHLVVSKDALGKAAWKELAGKVTRFFKGPDCIAESSQPCSR